MAPGVLRHQPDTQLEFSRAGFIDREDLNRRVITRWLKMSGETTSSRTSAPSSSLQINKPVYLF